MAETLLAGTATVTINGQPYALRGNFTYRTSGLNKTSIMGQDGFHGMAQKYMPGQIKMDLTDMGGLSVSQINALAGVPITASLANGKTVVGTNMSRVADPAEIETEDAKGTFTFEGPSVVDYVA